MIDPRTFATQGYLNSPKSIALLGIFYRVFGISPHKPLSVLIQGILYGPLHTATQGFVSYSEPPPRKRIAALMPKFMQTRTRFRF